MKTLLVLVGIVVTSMYQTAENDIQLPVNDKGEVEWSEVVSMDNVAKEELLKRALQYFKKNKKFGKSTSSPDYAKAQRNDEFILWEDNTSKFKCTYDVKLEVKDHKYKYIISNMVFEQFPKPAKPTPLPIDATKLYNDYRELLNSGKTKSKKVKNSFAICTSASNLVTAVMEEIKEAMNTEAAASDDW